MNSIKIKKSSIHFYCDKIFIHRMANLNNEAILDEEFTNQFGNALLVNMYYLPHIEVDTIMINKRVISIAWSEDIFSIIKLNSETLRDKGYLHTSELNFATNSECEDIDIYILLE